MASDFLLYALAGFVAQMVDGALGMAYGVTASSLLLSFGIPPAVTSATVHAAECFTSGASAVSHHAFGNIRGWLFRRLLVAGVPGAVAGAWLLARLPGDLLRPWVAGYLLLMGLFIVFKAFREIHTRVVTSHLLPLGFAGAFVDAVGGGGWGPIVASTLLARGNSVRETVGSVNAAEFFVALAASITFGVTIGFTSWQTVAALALGGMVAAPFGAWACRRLPHRPLMLAVGLLVIALSLRTLGRHFGWF